MTTYTVKTTLLDESRFAELCQSLMRFFPRCHPVQRRGNALTIRIELDEWYYHTDEFFDERKNNGLIGDWTVEPAL